MSLPPSSAPTSSLPPVHSLPGHRFSVAPMLDWTDRHCRAFHRCLTSRALLYTEMVTTGAVLHGDRARHLDFGAAEHPLALQLGGSDPAALAECAALAEHWGYDEVNLNCGCPSDRVQSGAFGACLMATPDVVAACVAAMQEATRLPVTVKHRIGIDDQEDYMDLRRFVETVAGAGCRTFIVHARKAWLKGLSPKENREIPPLRYELVEQLKAEFPELTISLNGGVQTLAQAQEHLTWADGVMVGRAAYQTPYLLARVDQDIFGEDASPPTRREVLARFRPYVVQGLAEGQSFHHLTKSTLGLFAGQHGARHYKRTLSELGHRAGAGIEVLDQAVAGVPDDVLDALD
ncbi:TIM-barrel protein, yjbN family [Deinococcus proteolyticus MRP]|uniref:tRNA-dihydrouridine(20/20a) synthase n=1 Tax=Deinococcus proteolyticus (strain ATCC 35074 / DSM 20540 / JCM 6276 / NBRC 101906 / NCIMB 13154 / VKM Ac-1939 / CCM 2703 / MRP) TaxID=693977 RepID=F0RIX9_DEIPM|nr:tRNA dihydrouridine(20/20a) synthase DusA [Deinococcus proteolyticus]ADY25238.1 TIM-barrel protein, yjbN family [Deinococcus proteolyticus MRP]